MSNSQFVGETFAGGLQAPSYTNGRLLTAEDLKADQEAMLARMAWLGQSAGYGIVGGLMVSQLSSSNVRVTAGTGLNRDGQLLRLPGNVTLSLAPKTDEVTPSEDGGRFASCTFQGPSGSSRVPGGGYLLVATPASIKKDLAPIKPAAGSAGTPSCASKWEVEGLQFKAVRLLGFNANGTGVTAESRRNLLAHWCFGSLALKDLAADPFKFSDDYGGLDSVPSADLTSCDLPLAVFHWTGSEITFVDAWSARRRLIQHSAQEAWRGLLSDKRVADSQARFLQFQDQLDALLGTGSSQFAAETHFRFLPPAGFLPINPKRLLERLTRIIGTEGIPKWIRDTRKSKLLLLDLEEPLRKIDQPSRLGQISSRASYSSSYRANEEITFDPNLLEVRNYTAGLSGQLEELQRQIAELKAMKQTAPDTEPDEPEQPSQPSRSKIKRQARDAKVRQRQWVVLRDALEGMNAGAPGVDLDAFFGNLMPSRIGVIDRETLDFSLHRSWYDEAIDLAASEADLPHIEIYIVADNLRRRTRPYVMFVKAMRRINWIPLDGNRE